MSNPDWAFPIACRYYENVVAATNTCKYWGFKIEALDGEVGCKVIYFWGRIGTKGQTKAPNMYVGTLAYKAAGDDAEADCRRQLREGYVQRDEAWVKRMWPDWRPSFAVDGARRWPVVDPNPVAAARARSALDNLSARLPSPSRPPFLIPLSPLPKRAPVEPPKPDPPVLAKRGKRMLDFTEDD